MTLKDLKGWREKERLNKGPDYGEKGHDVIDPNRYHICAFSQRRVEKLFRITEGQGQYRKWSSYYSFTIKANLYKTML